MISLVADSSPPAMPGSHGSLAKHPSSASCENAGMNESTRPVPPKKPPAIQRVVRVASWIPELLIDPLHIVEGTICVVGWLIRMCRSPQRMPDRNRHA